MEAVQQPAQGGQERTAEPRAAEQKQGCQANESIADNIVELNASEQRVGASEPQQMAQKPVSQEDIESMSENSTNKPKEEETKTAIQENQGTGGGGEIQEEREEPEEFFSIIESYKNNSEYDPIVSYIETGGVLIKVDNPIYHTNGLDNFVAYKIIGRDKLGDFSTFRRYSEFADTREFLMQNWPGFYIPPISPKKLISSNTSESINERLRFLTSFCKNIARYPFLYESQEFQILIRAKSINLSKQMDQIPKKSTYDFIAQIEKYIPEAGKTSYCEEIGQKVDNYRQATVALQSQLRDLLKQLEAESQLEFQYNVLTRDMFKKLIFDYESLILNYLTNENKSLTVALQLEDDSEHVKKLKKMSKSLSNVQTKLLQDAVYYDMQDTEAILKMIDSKAQFEKSCKEIQQEILGYEKDNSELLQGNTTIRSVFKFSQTRDQQIEHNKQVIDNLRSEAAQQAILVQKITVAACAQISRLQSEKKLRYKHLIRNISLNYAQQAESLLNIWSDYEKKGKQQTYNLLYN